MMQSIYVILRPQSVCIRCWIYLMLDENLTPDLSLISLLPNLHSFLKTNVVIFSLFRLPGLPRRAAEIFTLLTHKEVSINNAWRWPAIFDSIQVKTGLLGANGLVYKISDREPTVCQTPSRCPSQPSQSFNRFASLPRSRSTSSEPSAYTAESPHLTRGRKAEIAYRIGISLLIYARHCILPLP